MPIWLHSIMIALIPSLIVGIVTALVTVRLSLKRFHAERWWERKADTYSRLVESLYHIINYCDTIVNEEAGEKYSIEYKQRIQKEYSIAHQELVKATHVGAYIICDEAVKALEELSNRPSYDFNKEPTYEIFHSESVVYRNALTKIREIAKRDLGVT